MESKLDTLHKFYIQNLAKAPFDQIQHIPDQFATCPISVQQTCLCISHSFFQEHYIILSQALQNVNENQLMNNLWISQLMLAMNGQNDKAWNIKKILLQKNMLNLQRQLRFNSAVCFKNKKSSSYYDYRIRIFQSIINNLSKQEIKQKLIELYDQQCRFITKILARYFRNYYCWMYRNRLFKLFLPFIGEDLVKIERTQLHKFIDNNPNDYSAYSRLIAIISKHVQIVNKSKVAQEQIKWLNQLQEFCTLAYQHRESFEQILTYKKYLISIDRQKQ